MIEITEADLLLRLRNFEDNFVERKTIGDVKDCEKTVAAFANTTPVGYPAVLFVGVKNDGTLEDKQQQANLESLQKSVASRIQRVYPRPYYLMKVLNVDGRQCLAVIVPGSEERPHFTGPPYVRTGSESVIADQSVFDEMIAQRQSKPYEILRSKGKVVTVNTLATPQMTIALGRVASTAEYNVVDCNAFYVTLKKESYTTCIPLERISITFDTQRNQLALDVTP